MKVTLGGGVETENERHLEEKLGFGPLQITESEGARGIASVCAISSPLPPCVSNQMSMVRNTHTQLVLSFCKDCVIGPPRPNLARLTQTIYGPLLPSLMVAKSHNLFLYLIVM